MISRYALILPFLVLSSFGHAAVERRDCKDVDLSEDFGPVRNQGDSGICFAEVAADLIGFNQGLTPKERISALDVTHNFQTINPNKMLELRKTEDDWDKALTISRANIPMLKQTQAESREIPMPRALDGGNPELAIDAYNFRGGACLESQLPSEAPSAFVEKEFFLSQKIYSLTFPERAAEPDFLSRSNLDMNETEHLFWKPVRRQPKILCQGPESPFEAAISLRRHLNEKYLTKMGKSIAKACSPRTPLKPMKSFSVAGSRSPDAVTEMFAATMLGQGVPLGIGYDSSFLDKGSTTQQRPAGHASVLVGSRWNSKKKICEFKLRNSSGPNCDLYHKSFRKNCDAGNVWISGQDLQSRVDLLTVILPQEGE